MKNGLLVCTALAAFALVAPKAEALPLQPSALGHVSEAIDMTQKAQIYMYEGNRYCFYLNGWRGPGWYRCGYAFRRGLGWGGAYDWGTRFGWSNPGWERRQRPPVIHNRPARPPMARPMPGPRMGAHPNGAPRRGKKH